MMVVQCYVCEYSLLATQALFGLVILRARSFGINPE